MSISCTQKKLKFTCLIVFVFSTKEHLCLTMSLDTHLGVNTYKAWRKTVLGAIMWFCLLQRIIFKLPSVLSAVLTMRYLSSQILHLPIPPPLCWDTFTSYNMLAFSPDKVKQSFQSQTSWACFLDLWELCLKNLYTYSYFEKGCQKKCACDNPKKLYGL